MWGIMKRNGSQFTFAQPRVSRLHMRPHSTLRTLPKAASLPLLRSAVAQLIGPATMAALSMMAGCTGKTTDLLPADEVATTALDLRTGEASSSLALAGALLPTVALDPSKPLAQIVNEQAEFRTHMRPRTCVVTTTAGNRVTHTYSHCFGTLGAVEISGTSELTFRSADHGVEVATHGDLTLNGAVLHYDGVTQVGLDGADKVFDFQGSMSGTFRKGAFSFTGTSTWRIAPSGCFTRDGELVGALEGGRTFSLEHRAMRRCDFVTCPTGSVRIVSSGHKKAVRNFAAELFYDGSNVLRLEDEAGRSYAVNLPCDDTP